MMWFVREEFLWRPLSTKDVRPSPVLSLCPLKLRGSRAAVFSFELHPASVRKRVPRGVKGCRGDPRRDHAIILKLQAPIHRRYTKMPIHSCLAGNSQLRHNKNI
ncbi:hypothetical protein TNCV_3252171 [Trichonephila clavipes]|nr:hypothetical protein TNCV_3252171 [Trichonephila clavipes]